jgi:nucleoside-diphosphate-sugar epimerase
LVAACQKVPRFIFCSTQAVILKDENILDGDETLAYPDDFVDHYARSKAQAEQLVLREHPGATVLRPPWVWGAGDTNNLPTLLRPSMNQRIAYFAEGKNLLETVHALNFVMGAEAAAKHETTTGKIYFVTDDEPVRSGEFSNEILVACGLDANKRSLPAALGRALAWSGKRNRKGHPILTRSSFLYMVRDQVLSDALFREDTGYLSSVSRLDGLRDLKDWCTYVGGPGEVAVGRRRGDSRSLIERTWDYLLNCSKLI